MFWHLPLLGIVNFDNDFTLYAAQLLQWGPLRGPLAIEGQQPSRLESRTDPDVYWNLPWAMQHSLHILHRKHPLLLQPMHQMWLQGQSSSSAWPVHANPFFLAINSGIMGESTVFLIGNCWRYTVHGQLYFSFTAYFDHKSLTFALSKVTDPSSAQQQNHLAAM